ncbi:hypothetical protein VHEMI01353 [[Torrubiella] hemipterigena]|uniref:FAD binding domain protein n=1 Tax=[Torrubiella] hemipterigena TaxID=1531966 RepID=A0A0A1SSW7_9HYPO|nr:hypothetical protein VHEMI01353 [[Torrubiella] hemipterigena]
MSEARRIAQMPLHLQLDEFQRVLSTNKTLLKVLELAPQLGLSSWYLAAGSLSQTVWNHVCGMEPEAGISDYDLVYYDADDLSWEAEDKVIQAGKALFASIDTEVEIRNQARVHLWYSEKHGVDCAPHKTLEDGIDSWISNSAMIGVRIRPGQEDKDKWDIYAPWGISDMFNLVVRPNAILGTREAFEKKAARWKGIWPQLTVHPWPTDKPQAAKEVNE